ncbi:MAG: repeat protein [Adhaeribacter sp.]|nr:repeat protein [Adhaeribacter sp.]
MASSIQVQKVATLTGHQDCVYTLEQGGQPAIFYSAAGDGMVVAWDLENPGEGELVARVSTSVYALRWLPEQKLLVVGHNQNGLQVLDVPGKKIVKSVALGGGAFFDIAYAPGLQKIYVGAADGSLFMLDSREFNVLQMRQYAPKSVRCIAYNAARNELAVGYSDHFIRILEADTLALKHEFRAHQNSVFTVAYSPDGEYLLSGSRDAHLKVWLPQDGYQEHTSIIAHLFTINNLVFSPDGQYFATGSMDKSIKIWDARTFRLLKVIDKARHAGHGTSVNKLFWPARVNSLVSCSDDRTISVWELNFSLRYENNTIRDSAKNL